MDSTDKTDETKTETTDDTVETNAPEIIDAEVIQEEPDGEPIEDIEKTDAADADTDEISTDDEAVKEDSPVEPDAEEPGEEEPSETSESDESTPVEEPEIEQPARVDTPAHEIRETIVQRKGGFLPMLLGGIVAGAVGFGAGQYVNQGWPFAAPEVEETIDPFQEETKAALLAGQSALTELAGRVDQAEQGLNGIDYAAIDSIADTNSEVSGLAQNLSALSEAVAAFETRLDTLEKRPVADAVGPEAIKAYERELTNLRAAIETQRIEVETMARDAVAAEQNAEAQAGIAKARSALANVISAIDTGTGFSSDLALLTSESGLSAPADLSSVAADGVPTQVDLIDSFPSAARKALSAARSEATQDATGANRFATFFRDQMGARSVSPKDGNDPDAILSRAEAAVKAGDLGSALNEISSLPDAAQGELGAWSSLAETRLSAIQAVDALAQALNNK